MGEGLSENSRNASAPRALLYSIAAGIGGSGLDAVALETLRGAEQDGILKLAIALSNRQSEIPAAKIHTLRWHPARWLKFLGEPMSHGARRHAVDHAAASALEVGGFDIFHTWSGDSLQALRVAHRLGIPSLLEIPTWHRNKGKRKPAVTKSERERDAAPFPQSLLNRLLVTRQQVMEEYELADVILVLSEKARETFLAVDVPESKLVRISRGVNPSVFTPAPSPPARFRAVLVGSLSHRKGVPTLLEAWKKLALPEAELVLVGQPSSEVRALLRDAPSSVRVTGFVRDVASELRAASVHVFPSECEGSAKVTYEASSCGLPQITTREAGDVVVDGETGIVIPPNDVDALAEALLRLFHDPDLRARMGAAGRLRVVENFTWEHFRDRIRAAYRIAWERRR